MTKYVKSAEAITSNLLLWEPLHTQTSIKDTRVMEYFPQTSIDYSDTINFILPGNSKLMIDHIEIISEIRVLTTADENPADNVNISVVSNLANALWRNVEVIISGHNLVQSFDNSYNIGSWFDTVLNTSPERQDYLWNKEGFLMDDATTKNHSENMVFFPVAQAGVTPPVNNPNGQVRAKRISNGKRVILIADLNCSLFKQGKLLPTNLNISISLTKNYDGYILMEAAETHKVVYDKVYLRVTYQQPTDLALRLIDLKLKQQPAIYQAEKGVVSFHSIPTGSEQITFNNIFSGNLPVMFLFAIQDRSAYGKSCAKNPYTFRHMKKAQVYVNGQEYFTRPVEKHPHEDNMMMDALYQAIGYKYTGSCLITSKNFLVHQMVAVNLTADRNANKHHLNLNKTGEVKLDIELPEVAGDGLILLVYAYYDRIIEINSDREVREI